MSDSERRLSLVAQPRGLSRARRPRPFPRRTACGLCITALIVACVTSASPSAQDQAPNRREVAITARDFKFIPDRIEVTQDDLVRITLTSEGRVYSFAIDAYRIVKRVGRDQTIVFDFRADQPGTFAFYCNLTSVPACRDMKGTLVVIPR